LLSAPPRRNGDDEFCHKVADQLPLRRMGFG
jgi:hypothetical protein